MPNRFLKTLEGLKSKNRYRSCQPPLGLDLSSNDYLGFKDHPFLRKAALEAIENGMSMGAGGSRLLRGHCEEHERLEARAAEFFKSESSLYFSTGYAANFSVLTTLPSRHDVIIYDSLVHACMKEGLHAGHARKVQVAHNDLNGFEDALKRFSDQCEQIWIAVESVYSMDGDIAPLDDLSKMAEKYNAILIIDEAHATGVFGDQGCGFSASLDNDNVISIHTCGKALGSAGGLVCASNTIIDMMINTARPFIFSTAPPPLQAYITEKSLELLTSEDGQKRRTHLTDLIKISQSVLSLSETQIVPVILGDDQSANEAAEYLQGQGYDVRSIRPPTVLEGTARLRFSLNANLEKKQLKHVISLIQPFLSKKAA